MRQPHLAQGIFKIAGVLVDVPGRGGLQTRSRKPRLRVSKAWHLRAIIEAMRTESASDSATQSFRPAALMKLAPMNETKLSPDQLLGSGLPLFEVEAHPPAEGAGTAHCALSSPRMFMLSS